MIDHSYPTRRQNIGLLVETPATANYAKIWGHKPLDLEQVRF